MKLEVDKLKELAQILYGFGEKYWDYFILLGSEKIENFVWHIPHLFEEGDVKEIKVKDNYILITDDYDFRYEIPLSFYDKSAIEVEKLFIGELVKEISQIIGETEIRLENLNIHKTQLYRILDDKNIEN